MARRQLSEAQRWQIVGMHSTGMSFKAIGRQLGCHHTVVSRLIRKHRQTRLKPQWLPHRRLSLKTLRTLLRAAGLAPRRVINRPLLTDEHKRIRLRWCLVR